MILGRECSDQLTLKIKQVVEALEYMQEKIGLPFG